MVAKKVRWNIRFPSKGIEDLTAVILLVEAMLQANFKAISDQ
jgi:hypothetical protein